MVEQWYYVMTPESRERVEQRLAQQDPETRAWIEGAGKAFAHYIETGEFVFPESVDPGGSNRNKIIIGKLTTLEELSDKCGLVRRWRIQKVAIKASSNPTRSYAEATLQDLQNLRIRDFKGNTGIGTKTVARVQEWLREHDLPELKH